MSVHRAPVPALAGAPAPDDETEPQEFECDRCGAKFKGDPSGRGLFVWTRGEEIRYEEPPLCERCSSAVMLGALGSEPPEEEEEG